MTTEAKKELKNKILLGLEEAYQKMIVFKKQKKSKIIIIQNNQIVRLNP